MGKGKKGLFRVLYGRTIFILLLLSIQIAVLVMVFRFLEQYMVYIYGGFTFLTVIVMLHIINDRTNPMYKISWIVPVLLIPVFGSMLYLFTHLQFQKKRIYSRHKMLIEETQIFSQQNEEVLEKLKKENPQTAATAQYMFSNGGYPIYENTSVAYFPLGEDKFEEMKKQLEGAEKFIFMEYFIIEKGFMWGSILEILQRKAKQGVEVRVMYDGMCSLALLPYNYPNHLKKKGIKCKMFMPIKPALSTYQNNRDHRKILVIDGHTAFTGGVNLADEYINKKKRFGHWKDTAVMLKGDAVKSFTLMFLQMWNITEKQREDYARFINIAAPEKMDNKGYVMPYGDSPLDEENMGEQVYLDIIHQATKYIHIMTPYLILDNEMVSALAHAAKSGIETVIIMPHIPDKIYAFWLGRTYYAELLEAGVQIYEYTPGFVHAKSFISDNEKAVVGTINLDFRSLYLHFECAAYFYKNPEIFIMEQDFQDTLKLSHKITLEECRKLSILQRLSGRVLRLVAPLM